MNKYEIRKWGEDLELTITKEANKIEIIDGNLVGFGESTYGLLILWAYAKDAWFEVKLLEP